MVSLEFWIVMLPRHHDKAYMLSSPSSTATRILRPFDSFSAIGWADLWFWSDGKKRFRVRWCCGFGWGIGFVFIVEVIGPFGPWNLWAGCGFLDCAVGGFALWALFYFIIIYYYYYYYLINGFWNDGPLKIFCSAKSDVNWTLSTIVLLDCLLDV